MERAAWAIVPAAGRGERLGSDEPKPYLAVGARPMLAHVLLALASVPEIAAIVIAAEAGWQGRAKLLADDVVPDKRVEVVRGARSRRASVAAALAAVPADVERIVVHDAARPLVTPGLVEATLSALDRAPAAVSAVPVADTLKRVQGSLVAETVRRDGLWQAQTPQAFHAEVLREAHARAEAQGVEATDDAVLVEQCGHPVLIVPGDQRNLKVTSQPDLELADALLRLREGVPPAE